MRPSAGLRRGLYAVLAVLVATGLAWLVLDAWPSPADAFAPPTPSPALPTLLALHGSAAVLALMLAGALVPLHLRPAWRSGRHRPSGIPTAVAGALLIVTMPLLYYAGTDALRGLASAVHIGAGIALPLALLVHRRRA